MVIFHSYVKLPEGKCISLGKSSNKFHHVTLHFCCNHFQGGSQVGKMAIVFPVFQKTIKAGPNNPLPSINCNQVQSISMCYIYIMIIIIITTIIYSSIYIYTQPNTINHHLSPRQSPSFQVKVSHSKPQTRRRGRLPPHRHRRGARAWWRGSASCWSRSAWRTQVENPPCGLGKKMGKTRRYVMRMKKHWDLRKILGLVDLIAMTGGFVINLIVYIDSYTLIIGSFI